jgi:hypothetical protein
MKGLKYTLENGILPEKFSDKVNTPRYLLASLLFEIIGPRVKITYDQAKLIYFNKEPIVAIN